MVRTRINERDENMSKEKILLFLLNIFYEEYPLQELNYKNVDDYYAYIGYNLESSWLLETLGINSTSDLLEALKTVE